MPGQYIFEFERWPRAIFSSFPGESTWHVSLKLFAYLIYRNRAPLVERSVGQRFKPDLFVLGDDGRVRLWIDCGETSIRKLARVVAQNPVARVVIVKDTVRHLEGYRALADGALRDRSRLLYLAPDDALIDGMAAAMRQRNQVRFAMGPSGLRIELNGERFAGVLHRRGGVAVADVADPDRGREQRRRRRSG